MFPKHLKLDSVLHQVIEVFNLNAQKIDSMKGSVLTSNEILNILSKDLTKIHYKVEKGKKKEGLIEVPVLFGKNGTPEKKFYADALSLSGETVIEVEAGRAFTNNQFLKDVFQASMMVDVQYLVLAVRNQYRNSEDFNKIHKFLDVMYVTNRIKLDLKGILLIGY